jgi:hypothetical protein
MPFINGRFYANPAYGRSLERARRSNSGGVWSEDFPEQDPGIAEEGSHRRDALQGVQHSGRAVHRKHHGTDDFDAATTSAGITNQIYNETASLRPTSESGNGSDVELQRARLAMAHVIHNRAAIKMQGGLASDELNSGEEEATRGFPSKAYDAFGVSRYEARRSSSPDDPTHGARYFYFDYGQTAPSFAKGRTPVAVFGPFRNTVREKNANKDQSTEYLKVYQ